jgi:hypothetical protein
MCSNHLELELMFSVILMVLFAVASTVFYSFGTDVFSDINGFVCRGIYCVLIIWN